MKRSLYKGLSILMAIAMLMTAFTAVPLTVYAQTEGDWEYTAIPGQGASIINYLGTDENVIIPKSLGGESVNGFNGDPFVGKNIRSLTFPSTISIIPVELMKDQTNLNLVSSIKIICSIRSILASEKTPIITILRCFQLWKSSNKIKHRSLIVKMYIVLIFPLIQLILVMDKVSRKSI